MYEARPYDKNFPIVNSAINSANDYCQREQSDSFYPAAFGALTVDVDVLSDDAEDLAKECLKDDPDVNIVAILSRRIISKINSMKEER